MSYNPTRFHQDVFGGVHNIAHPAGARAHRELSSKEIIIPKSAVKHAIPSLSEENIMNLHGHYVHDEHHSPFASFLYNRSKEDLEKEQQEFVEKMNYVRTHYGAWDFHDTQTVRPIANFDDVEYKDMMNNDFPDGSWQRDETYVRNLISEGGKLVRRVKSAIYAEYGHPILGLGEDEVKEVENMFAIHIGDSPPSDFTGIAYINQKGFDMLVRKLLHAMITNDEFYYILGGHSAAAGHGNNFQQQYTMQFANILEPVFQKLGIRLIARNLAMGGLGTTHFSLGSSTLYGEKDFMMWDSGMTEKSLADQDLFNKQALLGGERVPILFGSHPNNLETETGNNLWYGKILNGYSLIPLTTDLDQVDTLPLATRYMKCDPAVQELCGDRGNPNKYHDFCWEDRTDYFPEFQNAHVGGQASWHPGDRWHQFESRKAAILFLNAFEEAFKLWERSINDEGFPLKESHWHVGEAYKDVQSHLKNYINGENLNQSECEKRWGEFGLAKACRIPLRGMGEFTPKNLGNKNSIHNHVVPAPNGYKPEPLFEPVYKGIDILPLEWKIPITEVDVHAVAIATTYEPSVIDQTWTEDHDKNKEGEANTRRMLRKATGLDVHQIEIIEKSAVQLEQLTPSRVLYDDNVIPGIGWSLMYESGQEPTGYCDGSPMSDCKRSMNNRCLLSGHNDGRTILAGNALSGWLVVKLPAVKEGLIFAKIQWWSPRGDELLLTKGWAEVNNGINFDADNKDRKLKAPVKPLPDDFQLDIAVNGNIIKTWNHTTFMEHTKEAAYNEAFYPFIDDESIVSGDEPEEIEVGLRIRSESNPKDASFGITHFYYG